MAQTLMQANLPSFPNISTPLTLSYAAIMLIQTEGIVLHSFSFKSQAMISKIYTLDTGLNSYMVHGVRSPKASKKFHQAFFQPLQMLHIIFQQKETVQINTLKEAKLSYMYKNLSVHATSAPYVWMMASALHTLLHDPDEEVFAFLKEHLMQIDKLTDTLPTAQKNHVAYSYCSLQFLIKLTKVIGIDWGAHSHHHVHALLHKAYHEEYGVLFPCSAKETEEAWQNLLLYYATYLVPLRLEKLLNYVKQ